MRRSLIAASVASACFTAASSASAADTIYWANTGANRISFANLDGSGGGGDLSTGAATVSSPQGVALDAAAGRIYWANANANKISYASVGGGGGGEVATGAATVLSPQGVAVDPAARRIYWANAFGAISFANLDGSGGGDLATTGATVNSPDGVAVDLAAGRIYWANTFGNRISFAGLGGGGGGDLPTGAATVNSPIGVAVDPAAARVYWANSFDNKISSASLAGIGADLSTGGATANAPAFPALLHAPRGAGAPQISGGSGSALTCSSGAWLADQAASFNFLAPQSYAYRWNENGTAIAGATSNSITPASFGSYTCQVTATNHAGSAVQTSAAVMLAAQLQSPGTPAGRRPSGGGPRISRLSLSPSRFRIGHGTGVTYTNTQASITTFTALRAARGFRAGRRCLAKRPRHTRKAAGCALYRSLGSFSIRDFAGRNFFHFTGRILGRNLQPGSYHFQAVPRSGGRTGAPITVAFKVVRR